MANVAWFNNAENKIEVFDFKLGTYVRILCIENLRNKLNYDRFADPNILGATRLVHSDLRIYPIAFIRLEITNSSSANLGGGPGAVVKADCLESRRSLVRTPLWPSSFKETNVSSPLIHIDLILWAASVTERDVLLARFSLYVHKGGLKHIHFISLTTLISSGRIRFVIIFSKGLKIAFLFF